MERPLHVVTGAFGYSGRWIAHHLLDQGVHVRTLTNAVGRDDPFGGQVEVHGLDFEDKERLVDSLRGPRFSTTPIGFATISDINNLPTTRPWKTLADCTKRPKKRA